VAQYRDARGRFSKTGTGGKTLFSVNKAEWNACEEKLKTLGRTLARKALGKALRAAMAPVEKTAEALAPVDTGRTRKAVKLRLQRRARDGSQAAVVGISRPPKYARKKKNAGLLSKLKGRKVTRAFKNHPYYFAFNELGTANQPARPFLRPALDRNAARVVRIFQASIAADLEQIAKAK
jgi:HK97 gp10 family phage protein